MRKTPQILRLAQLDDQHFVMACGHGLIHLTWDRATVRMSRDEFRHLGHLLEQAVDDVPPARATSHDPSLVSRADGTLELRQGAIAWILAPAEFQDFCRLVGLALSQLDAFLAAGFWEREAPEDSYPVIWEESQRVPFSIN